MLEWENGPFGGSQEAPGALGGPMGGPWEIEGAPGGTQGARWGVPDDPEEGPGAKLVKNVERYALLKGSWRGPWEAKVRMALWSRRNGGYGGKSIRNP